MGPTPPDRKSLVVFPSAVFPRRRSILGLGPIPQAARTIFPGVTMTDQSAQNSPLDAEQQAKQRKKRYKKSLNLPSTPFPMRANLAQNEGHSRKRWDKQDLYRHLLEARADSEPFLFHDGPPYANGSIHVGHLLNKVLKDIVVRSRNLMGERCHYIPGWDCHGLPIEHKVMTELVEKGKMDKIAGLDDDPRRMAIRRECARYANKFIKIQSEQMQRLLTLADYDSPYLTMTPDYEKGTLEVFADLVDQGIVYRDLKPVHWSIANQTALAEAELEYKDRRDPSIFVGFDVVDPAAVAAAFGVESAEVAPRLVIWTTTPWTLPANRMVAVHERYEYDLVACAGLPNPLVIAKELVAKVLGLAGIEDYRVLATVQGSELLGVEYHHPFTDWTGRVVAADYVTLEDGTGLVHTAPGHGQEDYQTGQREGLEIYCPVRGDGTYDDSVPEDLRGLTIWEANPKLIAKLVESGHMLHHLEFDHSYPHDWRSKTPVIFRCTEQWFIAVDQPTGHGDRSLRDLALGATDDGIRFVPGWGKNRMRGMLESRPDWCISRQRAWGLPIPAFRLADGRVLLTSATVRAVAEVFGREGSDAWFTRSVEDLLVDYDPATDPEAPEGLDFSGASKMYDIFDVWFESGSSWHSVMRHRGLGYPVDLYLEGSDQHRGWFQLSLLPGLGVTGESPFRSVLTHGFMVDREGKKMSKSGGNALEVDVLLESHGADVCRWWVSSLAFENDIKVDPEYFELAGESYRKVRNTLRFLLSNLSDYDPATDDPGSAAPTSLDAWVLGQAVELRQNVLAAYRNYEFRAAHLLLFDFCNDTLSAVYLDAVKDRLYCDRPDSPRRRSAQAAIWQLADLLCCLLAPVLPHTADEAWHALSGSDDGSVHLRTVPELSSALDDAWPAVHEVAEQVSKALETAKSGGIDNPLDAGVVVPDPKGELGAFEADLADLFGVSRVTLAQDGTAIEVVDLRDAPRCERSWRRDPTVALRSDGGWLSDRDADAVGVE